MFAIVNFYLTWKCNFFCAHCVHECGPDGNHMTMEQINYGFRFINWLLGNNIPLKIIGTTGGEPMIHPQFWDAYIPQLNNACDVHKTQFNELHTNASIPIPEEKKKRYWKFFSKIFVGHDPCHRKFASLTDLRLQDYTDISKELVLRQNQYPMQVSKNPNDPETMVMIVRNKGRASQSIKSRLLTPVDVQGYPRVDCSWPSQSGEYLHFCFTPDHINHCGEKGHPVPGSLIPEGQFHPYETDFDKLVHSAVDYQMKYCHSFCSQKCMAQFVIPSC